MDLTIIITAIYMYDQLVGFCKSNKKLNLILGIPGAISLLLIIGGIGQLNYLHGRTTYYSMGFSAYVCFASLFFHHGVILYLVLTRHKFLPAEKVIGTLSFIVIVGVILVI